MAVVNSEIRFAPQLTAWFTANATKVLQDGEIVYCSDGGNIGKYVIGDGTTALSGLTFYGGISAGGSLTVGTTSITGGTNTRVIYNNNGIVGEYAISGSGSVLMTSTIGSTVQGYSASTTLLGNSTTGSGSNIVLGTTPTFTTSIITPLVYGSSSVSGNFSLESTSNATKGIINIGSVTCSVRVGNGANNTGNRLFRIQQDTAWTDIGSLVGATSVPAIYFLQTAPSISNYALAGNATQTFLGASSTVDIRIAQVTQVSVTSNTFTFKDAANLAFNTSTGSKIGTATTQKLSFWNKTPIVQPTTAVTGATLVSNGGTAITATDTFGGYTLQQLAAIIINTGLAA